MAKNNGGKRFYNFLNFFTIFFGIFLPGSCMNGIVESNFVFTFSAYLILFGLKILPVVGERFYNFLNFFAIFFGIFLPGSSMNGILE